MNNNYYQAMLYYDYQNAIMHEGVKGRSGRYRWGSGERPYQRLERRRGFFARRKEKKAQKELLEKKKEEVKKQKELAEKRRIEQEQRAKLTAEKNELLKSGNPTALELKKYLPVMTDSELAAAVNRLNLLSNLERYASVEQKKSEGKGTFDKVDDFFNRMSKVNKWGETLINSYKNFDIARQYVDQYTNRQKQKQRSQTQEAEQRRRVEEQRRLQKKMHANAVKGG